MFAKKYCPSCRSELSMLSNRSQDCIVCRAQICSKCGVKSPSLMGDYACRNDHARLQQSLRVGNIVYCRKCTKFGQLNHQNCAFDGAPACSDCAQKIPCAEGHIWCGVCQYQAWSAQVPTIVLSGPQNDQSRPIRNQQGQVTGYHQYRNGSIGTATVMRCARDNPATVRSVLVSKADVAKIYSAGGQDVRPPLRSLVHGRATQMLVGIAQAARALGLDPLDAVNGAMAYLQPYGGSQEAFLTAVLGTIQQDPEGMGSLFIASSEQVVKMFLAHIQSLGAAREAELGTVPPWSQFGALPADVVRQKPSLAAAWVWTRGRALNAPHDAKRALAELGLDTPFFTGLAAAVDAMIAYDGPQVLQSLRQIRADPSVDPALVNIVGARVEVEAREVKEITPQQTQVTIGAVYQGDVISGTKIGSQVSTSMQVDNRQFLDQSHHVDQRHIGDNIAGGKVGTHIQDSAISGSTVGGEKPAAPGEGEALAGKFPKFCPECGGKMGGPAKFCPECGHRFA